MAEYDRPRYEQALHAAYAKGDAEAVATIAAEMRRLDAEQAPTAPPVPAPPARPPVDVAPPAPVPADAAPVATAPEGVLPFMGAVQPPPVPEGTPAEPSGFVPSVGAGALGGAQTGSNFLFETMKNSQIKDLAMAYDRMDKGLPLHPMWTPEAIQTRWNKANQQQAAVGGYLGELEKGLDYKSAEWDKNKPAWVSQTIGQALGSMSLVVASGPAAPVTGYMMAGGQVLDELKDIKTLTQAEKLKLAQVSGVPLAALERLGLGAIFGKVGGKGAKKVAFASISEGTTELLQDMGVIAIGASQGREYTQEELIERARAALVGGTASAGGITTAKAIGQALGHKNAEGTVRSSYGDNTDQMASDTRVAQAFEEKLVSMKEAGTDIVESKPGFVLRAIALDTAKTAGEVVASLESKGILSAEDATNVKHVFAKAHKGVNPLDQADFDIIQDLPLDAESRRALGNAARDINAAIGSSRLNTTIGPMEKMLGGGAVTHLGAGGMVGRVPGGRMLISGSLRVAGRLIDNVMEAKVPRVLQGISPRASLVAKAKGDTSNTMANLKGLYANIKQGAEITTSDRQKAINDGNRLRSRLRMIDRPGPQGFDAYVKENTGLKSAQVDEGLMRLLLAGDINIEQHASFYAAPEALMAGKQGLYMIDLLNSLDLQTPSAEDAGKASATVTPGLTSPEEARRTAKYVAVVRSAEAARDQAYKSINEAGLPPEQQQALIGLAGEIVLTENKNEKQALLTTALQSMPKDVADVARRVLSPVTKYGSIDPETATKIDTAVNK